MGPKRALDFSITPMAMFSGAFGKTTKKMGLASRRLQTVIPMRGNGKITRKMAVGCTAMLMGRSLMVFGKKI